MGGGGYNPKCGQMNASGSQAVSGTWMARYATIKNPLFPMQSCCVHQVDLCTVCVFNIFSQIEVLQPVLYMQHPHVLLYLST